MEYMFKRVTIIGVGLLGGSIGLALKKRKLAREVIGVFRRESSKKAALKAKAVDKAFLSIEEGVKGADFIIVCTPVGRIVRIVKEISKYAGNGAVVTDVGSTKSFIVSKLEKSLNRKVKFVGSHPMAGAEKSGVASAVSSLFQKSACIITKTRCTDKKAFSVVKKFWEKLGAVCKVLSPEKHDAYAAEISHLPHLVSACLVRSVEKGSLRYAAAGFKDTTRIASSDPAMWQDIFVTNKRQTLRALKAFKAEVDRFEKMISQHDEKKINAFLSCAKSIRDSINR